MKFVVSVGQEFPCYVAEEIPSSLVIHVTQNAHREAESNATAPKRSTAHFWVIGGACVLVGGAALPATLYGMATGDFSSLRAIADASRDVVQFLSRLLK